MAVTNGWGQGVVNNTIEWGKGSTNATNGWGEIYEDSPSGETAIEGASFTNVYSTEFDGVDDYVDCGHISDIQNASKVTISFWVKIDDTSFRILLGQNLVAGTDVFQLYYWGADTLYIWIKSGNVGTVSWVDTSAIVNIGQWYNFTIVFDGTQSNDDRCKLYINGGSDVITNRGTMPTTFVNSTESFLIGRGTNGYFDGNMDEVAVFNSALSSSDVTAIYNSGVPNDLSSYSSLVSWWRFEEGSGTTAIDSGTGGNDGTLVNGVAYSTNVP